MMHLIIHMLHASLISCISLDKYLNPNLYTIPNMQNMRFFCCSVYMPDSHKFVHYHWIRVYINHARAEIACVGIRYSLFQKQEKKSFASTMRKNPL